MFCALLLPQFISAKHDLAAQYLLLGAILVGLGLASDVIYALAASTLARRLSGSGTVRKFSRVLFAGILVWRRFGWPSGEADMRRSRSL